MLKGLKEIGVRPPEAQLYREAARDVLHVIVGRDTIGIIPMLYVATHRATIDWTQNKILLEK